MIPLSHLSNSWRIVGCLAVLFACAPSGPGPAESRSSQPANPGVPPSPQTFEKSQSDLLPFSFERPRVVNEKWVVEGLTHVLSLVNQGIDNSTGLPSALYDEAPGKNPISLSHDRARKPSSSHRPTATSSEVRDFGTWADRNIARSSRLRHLGRPQHRPKFGISALWPTATSPEVRDFGTWANCNIARSSGLRYLGQLQHRPKFGTLALGPTATWGSVATF